MIVRDDTSRVSITPGGRAGQGIKCRPFPLDYRNICSSVPAEAICEFNDRYAGGGFKG